MADTTTTNLSLVKPEIGASIDSWGTKINGDLDTVDALFSASGALAVASGGTGAANASAARTALGLVIGTDVQAYDADTTTLTNTQSLTNKTISGASNTLTVDGTDAVGFKNIPQNSQSADYTLVLADSGKHIFHPSGDANARTYTIPANASVAYPIGTAITFINMTSQVVSIAITTDTMNLSSAGTTGTRSLAQYGSATAIKIGSALWLISGSGLT